ncbi:MAG: hypothetical protein N2314_05985 [Brevinematales bacterium]|nr:hypothetical protein [Brevinematales bacterium]
MQKKQCDLCGRQDGVFEVHVYRENKPQKMSLCTRCAMKLLENNPKVGKEMSMLLERGGQEIFQMISEVRSLLGEIASQIHTIETQRAQSSEVHCRCGLTYEEFKENGYLGCPWCYETFRETVKEMILDIERGSVHRGMIPPRYTYFLVVQKEIEYLKRRLRHLLAKEAYEEAAKVHKKLKRILGKHELG